MKILEYDYVLFGEIQNIKQEIYEKIGKGISFWDAVEQLASSGSHRYGIPEIPDFSTWNLRNYRDLRKMIYQIPIPLSDVLDVKRHTIDNITYLVTKNKVQISLESCYSNDQLLSVDYFAVFYVLEGTCVLLSQYGKYTMQVGELCILPPDTPYSVFTRPEDLVINIISDKAHFEENFHALLYHDNIVSAFFRRALFQNQKEGIFFMLPPTKDMRSIIQHLFAEFVKRDSYSNTLFNNYLQIFYANIIRSTESTYDFYSGQKEKSAQTLMPAILDYLAQNYQSVTLDLLAMHFHYENAYLSKLIKAATGKNYSTIVTELKIKEASELLIATDKKIEEIAEIIGYNSADHFTYSFKKIMKMAPRTYRKTFHNNTRL